MGELYGDGSPLVSSITNKASSEFLLDCAKYINRKITLPEIRTDMVYLIDVGSNDNKICINENKNLYEVKGEEKNV